MILNRYFIFVTCLLLLSCQKQQEVGKCATENLEIKYVDSIYYARLKAPNDSIGREKLLEVASEYENRGVYIKSKQTLEEIFKRATKKKRYFTSGKSILVFSGCL